MLTPLVKRQIPEQAASLGITEEEVIKNIMLPGTVDGEVFGVSLLFFVVCPPVFFCCVASLSRANVLLLVPVLLCVFVFVCAFVHLCLFVIVLLCFLCLCL